jgi:hypothetical protein
MSTVVVGGKGYSGWRLNPARERTPAVPVLEYIVQHSIVFTSVTSTVFFKAWYSICTFRKNAISTMPT